MAKDAFESLLETLSEDVRGPFSELVTKEPKLKSAVMAQGEFSRKMDELRDKTVLADRWQTWKEQNWDDDQRMTRAEITKTGRIQELETELETTKEALSKTGDDVTFDQLTVALDQRIKDRSLLTRPDVDSLIEKKSLEVQDFVKQSNGYVAEAALVVPWLNQKHSQEFGGELFDPKVFMKEAHDKGRFDLADFYEKDFVVGKRQDKVKADYEARLKTSEEAQAKLVADAEERGRRTAMESAAMGEGGRTPVDSGGPDLGPLQKMLGRDDAANQEMSKYSLDDEGLARAAAKEYLQNAATARSA